MNPPRVVSTPGSITDELRAHLELCEEVLEVVSREGESLRAPGEFAGREFAQRRESILPRLVASLEGLRRVREAWQGMDAAERARQGDAEGLMRRNQDLIMRILVLDRENEQVLLRRGLIPPSQLPSSQRQRPHAVAARYFRHVPNDPTRPPDSSACPSSAS